ncbi:hypothetical protein [Burkholderia sp. PU8-34]
MVDSLDYFGNCRSKFRELTILLRKLIGQNQFRVGGDDGVAPRRDEAGARPAAMPTCD